MVKFTAEKDGERLIGLGVTAGNVERLKRGDPIRIDLAEMGVEGVTLLILYGETESDIAKLIQPGITKDTIVYDHERGGEA